jgi:hypothetical protein
MGNRDGEESYEAVAEEDIRTLKALAREKVKTTAIAQSLDGA